MNLSPSETPVLPQPLLQKQDPPCCTCRTGECTACRCCRNDSFCSNCLPSKRGSCKNQAPARRHQIKVTPQEASPPTVEQPRGFFDWILGKTPPPLQQQQDPPLTPLLPGALNVFSLPPIPDSPKTQTPTQLSPRTPILTPTSPTSQFLLHEIFDDATTPQSPQLVQNPSKETPKTTVPQRESGCSTLSPSEDLIPTTPIATTPPSLKPISPHPTLFAETVAVPTTNALSPNDLCTNNRTTDSLSSSEAAETLPLGPVWVLYRNNSKAPVQVFPAKLRRQAPPTIEYEDDGAWEVLPDISRIRPRHFSDEPPPPWLQTHFISQTYQKCPEFLLPQKLHTQQHKKEDSDDELIPWPKPKKTQKKAPTTTTSHSDSETPPPPLKQTLIPEFFSPTANCPNSPSPHLTLNGKLSKMPKKQSKITTFCGVPPNLPVLSDSLEPSTDCNKKEKSLSSSSPTSSSTSSSFSSSSSSLSSSKSKPSLSLQSHHSSQSTHSPSLSSHQKPLDDARPLSSKKNKSKIDIERPKESEKQSETESEESDSEENQSQSDSEESESEEERKSPQRRNEETPPKLPSLPAKSNRTQDPDVEDRSWPAPANNRTRKEKERVETDPYPNFLKANFDPTAKWKRTEKTLGEIKKDAQVIFEKMRFWPKNIWKAPGGKTGKNLIQEQTFLIESWNKGTNLELIALTLNMIYLPLMLQKSGKNVKAKAIKTIVQERIEKWNSGHLKELLEEAEYLQTHLQNQAHRPQNSAKIFAKLMLQGKVNAALRIVSNSQGGVAKPSPEVLKKLKEKHPEAAPTDHSVILPGDFMKVPDSIWEKIDGQMIRSVALSTKGAAGWSGIDSDDLRPLICSKNYGRAAEQLCDAIADLTKRLCKTFVDPESLTCFLACRLIPLEKGENDVRPIGIGETLRRIVGKAAVRAIRGDIQAACGSLQVCAGLESGCEAAVHAVRESFEAEETEAALLIDASNAFNSVKRECTLQNIATLCPSFYIFLVNTYRRPIRLVIPLWKEEIYSLEGTTQGDPAAMGMYALSVIPLIRSSAVKTLMQAWYADDGTGVGKLLNLREWWEKISTDGPKYGYYANAKKTILIVKPQHETLARSLFGNTGVDIQANGTRHLGAAIGTQTFIEEYVKKKVGKWQAELQTLTSFALTEPQAAYSAFVFGFKGKWNFLQRTMPNTSHLFLPLEDALRNNFLPTVTGRPITQLERDILSLPTRNGGLGVVNPTETAEHCFNESTKITKELTTKIREQKWDCPNAETTKEAKNKVIQNKRKQEKEKHAQIKRRIQEEEGTKKSGVTLLKALECSSVKGASSWLTTLPLQDENRVLNKCEFRDALAMRYGWKPKNLPQKCACGKENSIAHCLDCKLGGFVSMRHDQIRNTIARLMTKAGCKSVEIEQQLLPVEGELDDIKGVEKGDEARMDVTAVGFWGACQRAFFDIRVCDPFAPSYSRKPIPSNLKSRRGRKNITREFLRLRNHLSPLLCSLSLVVVEKNAI